jgi:hypothetical protein
MEIELLGNGVSTTPAPTNPKRFTSLITQTGSNIPTQVILENTAGISMSFNRNNVGEYSIVLATALPINKYSAICGSNLVTNNCVSCSIAFSGTTLIALQSGITSISGGSTILADDLLVNTMLEILVYD